MRRRIFSLASLLSLLLCVATAVLWVRERNSSDELYVATGSRTVWSLSAGLGALGVDHFSGWPRPVRFYHVTHDADPLHEVTPVFAFRWAGANRAEWKSGNFYFAYGTVCVVMKQDGTVDYGRPALPVLLQLASQKFSAPFPFWSFAIPCWLAAAVFAILPTVAVARPIVRRIKGTLRMRRHRCPSCGYNLTGNTSGVCPECGMAISARS